MDNAVNYIAVGVMSMYIIACFSSLFLSNFINFYQILSKLHLSLACFLRLYCSISRGEHKRKKMATKFKALVGFTRMKDDELMVTAATIIGAMTDNVHFEQPTPTLAVVQGLLDDFSARLSASRRRGSPEETALKNESRLPLEAALRQLAYYVNSISDGHLSTLLSSGFPTNSAGGSVQVPLKVEGVKLGDGRQSGQVRLDFARQRNVLVYEYQFRIVGGDEWSERFTTSSSRANIIAPLAVAERHEVRVRAVNTQGTGDWSDNASILVR